MSASDAATEAQAAGIISAGIPGTTTKAEAAALGGDECPAALEPGKTGRPGYKIWQRYQRTGVQGLTDHSRWPYRHANQPRGLEELDHPCHDWTAVISACGRNGYRRRKINVSPVFAGQTVGVRQVDDHLWLVTFMHGDFGRVRR